MHFTEFPAQEHPGWAIRDKRDGEWVAYAHGFFFVKDAFYADVSASKEEAEVTLKSVLDDYQDSDLALEIVPAWEPLCGKLRHRVKNLEQANKISPRTIFDIISTLEDVISELRPKKENE